MSSWYQRMADEAMERYKSQPRMYAHTAVFNGENEYVCTECGWHGYPDASGGWCPTQRIPCPECNES